MITQSYLQKRVDNMNAAYGTSYTLSHWSGGGGLLYALRDGDGNRVGQWGYSGQRMESLLDGVADTVRDAFWRAKDGAE